MMFMFVSLVADISQSEIISNLIVSMPILNFILYHLSYMEFLDIDSNLSS